MSKSGIQNKYLKNKTINTDKSPAINFTRNAMVIVQITSATERKIPTETLLFLKCVNISDNILYILNW